LKLISDLYRKQKESAGVVVDGKDAADADIEDELLSNFAGLVKIYRQALG
jgi:hypothetical protein